MHFDSLQALSSSLSDHSPILLANDRGPKRPRSFRFEIFLLHMPGFKQSVKTAWNWLTTHTELCHIHFNKLKNVILLKRWSKSLFSGTIHQLHMALCIILHPDLAMKSRPLSLDEMNPSN